jgi:5-methylthioribose kinase
MLVKSANLFGSPVELDDAWIADHKDHSLCWMNHTVFDKKKNISHIFKECICYSCTKIARKLIGDIGQIKAPVTSDKKAKVIKGRRSKIESVFF